MSKFNFCLISRKRESLYLIVFILIFCLCFLNVFIQDQSQFIDQNRSKLIDQNRSQLIDQSKSDFPQQNQYSNPQQNETFVHDDLSVFNLAIDCIRNSGSPHQPQKFSLLPFEERQAHFEEIKNNLMNYSYVPKYCYIKYCGPWIEEIFRDYFINKSYDFFGPFVPLFVQWLGITKLHNGTKSKFQSDYQNIFRMLRDDVLYITIVQHMFGLEGALNTTWGEVPPNILILSPTSRGHIPTPHFKELLQPVPILQIKKKFLFMGIPKNRKTRPEIVKWFRDNFPNDFESRRSKKWVESFQHSEIILSPRGYARGCFRTFEILQLGMVPLIIHDGTNWLPYWNSSLDWSEISYIVDYNKLDEMKEKLKKVNHTELDQMRKKNSPI